MKTKFFLTLFFALAVSSFILTPAKALDFTPPPFKDSGYLGRYISVSLPEPIKIEANQTKEVIVKIKNVGKKTWFASGSNFVSAYTIDPNYHDSVLADNSWIGTDNPARISNTTKPGETATIKFNIKAPSKAGTYTEKFYLAAENTSWIKSSYFNLTIKVDKSAVATSTTTKTTTTTASSYTGKVLGLTNKYLTAAVGGDQIDFSFKFQNLSKTDWQSYSLAGETVSNTIKDSSWESDSIIITRKQKGEAGKDTGWINFKFRAPRLAGDYNLKFYLKIDGQKVSGTEEVIKLKVLEDGELAAETKDENISETVTTTSTSTIDTVLRARTLIAEPTIRVRLAKVDSVIKFVAPTVYKVYAGSEYKGELESNVIANLNFLEGDVSVYTFKSPELNFTSTERIRFEPENDGDYFEVPTFARTITWKGETRFASYRGVMEFVHSAKSNETYLVNELPMNQYLNGIGEMSDDSPYEYMKAMIVAARSYAYSQIVNGPVPRTYDVYASTVDQLYLGYNHEIDSPNLVKAVADTAGEMVTYKGKPVDTPYYGHSDGRTRSWKELYGGDKKPWLLSVKTPYDNGKKMFGHGVGISMDDAASRARKDGWNYLKILKYYYTGVEVEQVY